MSVPNAGMQVAAAYPEAEDAPVIPEKVSKNDEDDSTRLLAPDVFDPKYEASQKEIWSYYLYYVGNNGLTCKFPPVAYLSSSC